MASRVLLISLNRFALPDPVFPLGLAHLNAALRRAGHEVRWLDCLVDQDQLPSEVAAFQPDFIGISIRNIDDVNILKQERLFQGLDPLCQNLRRLAPVPLILGGSGFSIFPRELLEWTGADYGICGEGEASLVSLLTALETGGDVTPIAGLVWRDQGRVRRNPSPGRSTAALALEEADFPAPLVDHYRRASGMLNLQTQRGCVQECCYCTYPLIEGRHHRRRPPEQIAADMERWHHRGVSYVCIVDSVFNSTPSHVAETCEAILRRQLPVKWSCFLRPKGLTPELVRLMGRAGLAHVEFGSDSLCDEVLEAYGKQFTFEDVLQANERVRQEGIEACHFLICGGPGETRATLETTFRHSRLLREAPILAVVGMRIYPDTALFHRAVREGVILPETNLLDPVYYLGPGLDRQELLDQLQAWVRQAPHWIVGEPSPAYARMVQRLRQRGVVGPLWSYFAMMQRLQPQLLAPAQP